MLVLDTNVISEVFMPEPSWVVMAFLDSYPSGVQAMTATTVAELLAGAAIMPEGKKRRRLESQINDAIAAHEILPFDTIAARYFSDIVAGRTRAGRPISTFDAQIAATARAHDAILATRDLAGFSGCGVEIINPWDHRP